MSDSDDTDLLLLIPPDLFLVPSSSVSDTSSDRGKSGYSKKRTGVISELVGHMQTLESRITAIESKDNSLDATVLSNSLDSQIQNTPDAKFRQTLPRTRFHVNQSSSLQNTPVKPRRSLSVPSTPNGYSLSDHTNICRNDIKLGNHSPVAAGTNATNANDHDKNKHDFVTSRSDSSVVVSSASRSVGLPHATATPSKGELYSYPGDYCRNTNNMYVKPSNRLCSMPSTSTLLSTTGQPHSCSKTGVQDMELSEVDELLQEMEATELELSKRINRVSMHQSLKEQSGLLASNQSNDTSKSRCHADTHRHSINRKLEFEPQISSQYNPLSMASQKKYSGALADISLPDYDSFRFDETDKVISEFKTWEQNVQKPGEVEGTDALRSTNNIDKSIPKANNVKRKGSATEPISLNMDNVNSASAIGAHSIQTYPMHKNLDSSLLNDLTQYNNAISTKSTSHLPESYQSSQYNGTAQHSNELHDAPFIKGIAHASTNTEFLPRYIIIVR